MPKIRIPWLRAERYSLSRLGKNDITLLFFLLLIVAVVQSLLVFFGEWAPASGYQIYVGAAAIVFVAAAIVFGGLTLWHHRDKIATVPEATEEVSEEEERKAEFGQKFPGISRVPGVRWFVRWMYKEGWGYSVALILLLAIGLGLRLWNLGVPSFGDDEFTTAYVAKDFADSGSFTLPSGITYSRSWIDIFSRALSIKLFGFDEFGARFPSVIFGSLTIGLGYLLGKELGGKKVGLIAAFIICFLPWEISWSREARMYALFQLLYLGLLYTTYLALVKYRTVGWYILSFVLFIAALATHQFGIVFIAVPYCWVLLNFWRKRQLKRFLAMSCAALVLFVLSLLYYEKLPLSWSIPISPFSSAGFLGFLFCDQALLTAIGILGMFCLILSKNKLGVFITIGFIVPLLILTCFLGWQAGKYIYFLIPLLIVSGSFMAVHLWRLAIPVFGARKYARVPLIFILLIFLFAIVPFGYALQIPRNSVLNYTELYPAFDSMTHPDWKGLKKEFSHLIGDGSIIIGTHQLGNFYCFGENTYYLRREEAMLETYFYLDAEGEPREIYAGSIWIKDYAEFISVVQDNDAFLIVDHRFARYWVTEDVIDYVNRNGTLLGSKGELKIYFLEQME